MRKTAIFLILTSISTSWLHAQEAKHVQLGEVQVETSQVINKPDGQLILPSKLQKESSPNGYSLLAKLALPSIRVDEVMHSITALNGQGEVQIRINGALASREDLMALDPKSVKNVNFINNPALRYGSDVAFVIDVRTARRNAGYTLGVHLQHALTTRLGNGTAFGRLNNGKSEFGISYSANYRDFRGNREHECANYQLNDGSIHRIEREDVESRSHNMQHSVELKYSWSDVDSRVFQASLSGEIDRSPGDFTRRIITDGSKRYWGESRSKSHSFRPVVDLYFNSPLGAHQSIVANVVGTHIATGSDSFNDEGMPYGYHVDGNMWSVLSEAIYENRLKPFTLSLGFKHHFKHTRNEYSQSVEALTMMKNQSYYLFGELKGTFGKFTYMAGLGVSNDWYHQGKNRYSYWLFRPKFTTAYAFSPAWTMKYDFETYRHVSKIAMINDTRIRLNSMEWTVGNPNLKPGRVVTNRLGLTFVKKGIFSQLDVEYRANPHSNMALYQRSSDNQFYYTQRNQKGISMFYVRNTTQYSILPDKLVLSAYGGFYRFFNRGDNYTHFMSAWNGGCSVQAYLGKFTVTANADNGWKFVEGETLGKQGAAIYFTCSYRMEHGNVSLFVQHPFNSNPRLYYSEVLNEHVKKQISTHGTDYGNMVSLSFSVKLNRGNKYRDIEKKLQNQDNQTGILSYKENKSGRQVTCLPLCL